MNTELEGKTVDNTHPAELKRLHNEKSDMAIEGLQKKKEFSIVSFIFFMLVSIVMYVKPVIFSAETSIVPSVIAFAFSLAVIAFELCIKDGLRRKRMTNLLLGL